METYNVGDVIGLDEEASVGNAASYALYYSCMFLRSQHSLFQLLFDQHFIPYSSLSSLPF